MEALSDVLLLESDDLLFLVVPQIGVSQGEGTFKGCLGGCFEVTRGHGLLFGVLMVGGWDSRLRQLNLLIDFS